MSMSKYSPVVKQITLSKEQKDLIVGTLFGDGHLAKPARNARYQATHGKSQEFYIKHKADILNSICPNGVIYSKIFDKRNNKTYPSLKFCTYTNEYLTELYKIFYPQRKKVITKKSLEMLNPRSIAYWYMDDGGLGKFKKPTGSVAIDLYLNTYMSEKEHKAIIKYFKKRYGIEFRLNKNHGKYRLRIGKKQAKKFIKIVEPYILPEFKYKINFSK